MRSSISTSLGLAALTVAAPANQDWWKGHHGSSPSHSSSGQMPFKFPLANGFPNLTADALKQVEITAQGTLPNTALPANVSDNSLVAFRVIAFNEIFEVAYFTSLIQNITNNVPGYQINDHAFRDFALRTLNAVQAQEELHATGANAILSTNNADPIQPCEYVFPTSDFDSAIALASTFTDLVLGTLQDVQEGLGINRDTELLRLVSSIVGQEGEQDGFYRAVGNKIPSALPFLTTAAGPFAFSALNQLFVVKGSCPNINTIDVPVFGALSVMPAAPAPKDQMLTFSFMNDGKYDGNCEDLSLVYINQQNMPIVESVQNVKTDGKMVSFMANFPYTENLLNGLTIAAVTKSKGPFMSADQVAADTLFGPGLIEIN